MTAISNSKKGSSASFLRRSMTPLLLLAIMLSLLVLFPQMMETMRLSYRYQNDADNGFKCAVATTSGENQSQTNEASPSSDAPESTIQRGNVSNSHRGECSCFDPFASQECCQRYILTGHKFGYMKTVRTFEGWKTGRSENYRIVSNLHSWGGAMPKGDFRHVWITRNWFHAMVSGYLYHKEGKECWLDPDGNDEYDASYWGFFSWMKGWQGYLTLPHPPPQSDNTTLCQYLNDVSTEDGMKVLMEFSLRYFYDTIAPYWNGLTASQYHKVMHFCYQDFTKDTIPDVLDFMFPRGGYGGLEQSSLPRLARMKEGHSTSKNATLRDELLDMVHRLDGQFFRSEVSNSNAIFGCEK